MMWRPENRRLTLVALFLLVTGVFTGSGLGTPPAFVEPLGKSRALQPAKSPLVDQAAAHFDGQFRAQNSASRQQPSGTITAGGVLGSARVTDERTVAEARFHSLTFASGPNDRAPPQAS